MRINVTSLVEKDNGTFKTSAEDCGDFMVRKMVTENLAIKCHGKDNTT